MVHRAQDVGIYGRERDEAVAAALAADERQLVESDSPWTVPAGTLRTGSGGAFKVYSAYLRAWRQQHLAATVRRPSDVPTVDGVRSDQLPAAPPVTADLPEPGEAAAHRALDRFVASRLDAYATNRNDPGADATSRLSPYLKWGCLHPRQLLRRLDGRKPAHDTFAKELAWRDFSADVLDAWPESAWHSWNPQMADMRVDGGTRAEERLEAWRDGRTGFPIVDAGMRQLVAEGWMHNRVRMITASFLVKDLHVDWTRGARFFLAAPRRRRPVVEQPRLAVGRRHGHRCGAVLPDLQPDDAGPEVRPRRHVRAPLGPRARRPRRRPPCTSHGPHPTAHRPATRRRSSTTPPSARSPCRGTPTSAADERSVSPIKSPGT